VAIIPYIVNSLAAIVFVLSSAYYFIKIGVFAPSMFANRIKAKSNIQNITEKETQETQEAQEIRPFDSTPSFLTSAALLIIFVTVGIDLFLNTSGILNYAKLMILLGLLGTAAVIDFRLKIIPNLLVYLGLGYRIIIYVFEFFFHRGVFSQIIVNDLIGFAIGFGILLAVALITKQAIGFGDVKLFGIIGLMSGTVCTYTTLFISMVISALVSVILLITKKKSRKDTIPFGPCIFVGYCISVLLKAY
jgi:prepilin signal peptidase PulO-like enzyme (type II secretory pathway)